MTRKILIGIIIVLVLGIAVAGVFILGLGKEEGGTTNQPDEGVVSLFPSAADKDLPVDARLTSATSSVSENFLAEEIIISTPGIKRITPGPISGATFANIGTTTHIFYMEKGSGHIFFSVPSADFPIRVSNATLPRVQEVTWGNSSPRALRLITNSHKDAPEQMTHLLSLPAATSSTVRDTGELVSGLLAPFKRLVASPDAKSVFYLEESTDGITGSIADFELRKPKKIFSHFMVGWEIDWPGTNLISVQSRAAAGQDGLLLTINPATGVNQVALSGIPGLSAKLSPAGTHILYSQSNSATSKLFIRNIKTASSTPLNLDGLADKCAWDKLGHNAYCATPGELELGEYPDSWYRGEVSFNDTLWRVDTDGTTKQLYSFSQGNNQYDVDAMDLKVDSSSSFLIFTNKSDGSLWLVDLKSFL